MKTLVRILLIGLLAPVAIAAAQGNPPAPAATSSANPLSGYNRMMYRGLKAMLLRSAEKMPEENYSFKPTEAVRSFGQILGHVTEAQYIFCSKALGEKAPEVDVEAKTSKADLIATLKQAFAYCDKAYEGMTDAAGTERVKFMGGDTPKLGVLSTNNVHTAEHYGNLITYLRMKGIVPPSSEPEFMKELMKK